MGNPAIALGRALPTRAVRLRSPPTRTRVGSAPASAAARWPLLGGVAVDKLRGGCLGAGRVAPLRPPEPGYLRNSALGLWGAKCNPKRVSPEPRADKHAQARTQTSPRLALAAAGPGVTEEPGARDGSPPSPRSSRARPLALAARRCDGSARRHRPGATAQRPVWACSLRGPGRTGAAAGHSW